MNPDNQPLSHARPSWYLAIITHPRTPATRLVVPCRLRRRPQTGACPSLSASHLWIANMYQERPLASALIRPRQHE